MRQYAWRRGFYHDDAAVELTGKKVSPLLRVGQEAEDIIDHDERCICAHGSGGVDVHGGNYDIRARWHVVSCVLSVGNWADGDVMAYT